MFLKQWRNLKIWKNSYIVQLAQWYSPVSNAGTFGQGEFRFEDILKNKCAISSVVERFIDIEKAAGSIPASRTF